MHECHTHSPNLGRHLSRQAGLQIKICTLTDGLPVTLSPDGPQMALSLFSINPPSPWKRILLKGRVKTSPEGGPAYPQTLAVSRSADLALPCCKLLYCQSCIFCCYLKIHSPAFHSLVDSKLSLTSWFDSNLTVKTEGISPLQVLASCTNSLLHLSHPPGSLPVQFVCLLGIGLRGMSTWIYFIGVSGFNPRFVLLALAVPFSM